MTVDVDARPLAVLGLYLDGEEAMESFGEALGAAMASGLIFLEGDLGAGKTTLCRGILRGRGHAGPVKSPTYTLVEPYELDSGRVFHFDLYRLGDPEELEYMGIRDYFEDESLGMIEWPERGAGMLPRPDLRVTISVENSGRRLVIMAPTRTGEQVLTRLESWQSDSTPET